EIILLFMKFIDSIGNDILQICSKLMNRTAEDVLLDFLRLSMFSERDFSLAQNFYISKYIYVKEAFMNSLRQHLGFLFQRLESILKSTYKKRDINIQLKEILPFKKNFLKWILTTYNTTSNVVNEYFNFILHLRVIIDIFEESFSNGMPLGFSMQDIEMIKELFHYFVYSGCIFKKEHLDIIQLCNDEDILDLFFDHFIIGTTQSQKEWL
ncbi:9413_t:CDS:1, partial [Racocetra persica]